MFSIEVRCPNPKCELLLAVPAWMQGQRVRCAGCGETFLAPPPKLPQHRAAPTRRTPG